MQTRIRKLRKTRGWTLRQLADQIGTTPQTVQRLETANMTVSMDWLEKFANAFNVSPVDLMETSSAKDVECIGEIGGDGALDTSLAGFGEQTFLSFDIPAHNPIAVRITQPVGAFLAGTVLVADRLARSHWPSAIGWDCLVAVEGGPTLLRRLVEGQSDTYTLVPLTTGTPVLHNQRLDWVARLVMRLDYL